MATIARPWSKTKGVGWHAPLAAPTQLRHEHARVVARERRDVVAEVAGREDPAAVGRRGGGVDVVQAIGDGTAGVGGPRGEALLQRERSAGGLAPQHRERVVGARGGVDLGAVGGHVEVAHVEHRRRVVGAGAQQRALQTGKGQRGERAGAGRPRVAAHRLRAQRRHVEVSVVGSDRHRERLVEQRQRAAAGAVSGVAAARIGGQLAQGAGGGVALKYRQRVGGAREGVEVSTVARHRQALHAAQPGGQGAASGVGAAAEDAALVGERAVGASSGAAAARSSASSAAPRRAGPAIGWHAAEVDAQQLVCGALVARVAALAEQAVPLRQAGDEQHDEKQRVHTHRGQRTSPDSAATVNDFSSRCRAPCTRPRTESPAPGRPRRG
ncbi:MAG: hypothetical protein IPJ65_11835 [Archangiaceae bacterium]|nr:hypothetical protein [Archangiaceae bacterium]